MYTQIKVLLVSSHSYHIWADFITIFASFLSFKISTIWSMMIKIWYIFLNYLASWFSLLDNLLAFNFDSKKVWDLMSTLLLTFWICTSHFVLIFSNCCDLNEDCWMSLTASSVTVIRAAIIANNTTLQKISHKNRSGNLYIAVSNI